MSAYLDELFSLDGSTALVTGGSSGIGYAIAAALGRAGSRVVVVARDAERLAGAVEDLISQGIQALAVRADLADRSGVDSVVAQTIRARLDVDILVNCAGVNLRPPMGLLTDADVEATMAVNLMAPYSLGQHFGPLMAARGWGRIINVGSQQSFSAFGDSGIYGVSKAAIAGLSRSQAEAWSGQGVCVNTVVPGFVATAMTAPVSTEPGRADALAARTMIGRNGQPSDFAGMVVFLASRSSGYVTGQTLCVDGGFSVH
jgi:NAD(P)-dependent dehydrogenase (short-subunit alcohol dehydrogenase family)